MNEFDLSLLQRSYLRSSNNSLALQKMLTFLHMENIRQKYNNIRLKLIPPTLNDEFELPDGSDLVLNIKYYI